MSRHYTNRMGKKTLYLDLDALERIDKALKQVPGRPSVSALVNHVLPQLADMAEAMQKIHSSGNMNDLMSVVDGYKASVERQYDELQKDLKSEDPPTT